MVNDKVVSRFVGTPGREDGGIIQYEPLYPADEVLDLLEKRGTEALRLWTNKCHRDVQDLVLDHEDIAELLQLALKRGRFKNAQWCKQKPGGPWAACDAYTVIRSEWIDAACRSLDIEYYVKFALNKSGTLLLIVSCHTSH
jgi:hypothetical protein